MSEIDFAAIIKRTVHLKEGLQMLKMLSLILSLAVLSQESHADSRMDRVISEFESSLVGSHYDCKGSNVVSSFIEALAYCKGQTWSGNPTGRNFAAMLIRENDTIYTFDGMDQWTYNDWFWARSIGAHFNENIRGRYNAFNP